MDPELLKLVHLHQTAQVYFAKGNLDKIKQFISPLFESLDSVLYKHAHFLTYCKHIKSNKSFAFFVAKNLEKWFTRLGDNMKQKVQSKVDEEMKTILLPVIIQCHSTTAAILIKIFMLDKPPNEFLKPYILDLIAQEKFKDAISLAYKLNMQEQFSLFDMAIPILTQNKPNLVEEYLKGSKNQQTEAIKMVDTWIDPEFDLISFLQEKSIFQVRGEFLRSKFLMKLLVRWLKLFVNIDEPMSEEGKNLCPNLYKKRALGNLRFILYRHYVEEVSSVENTQELIIKSVDGDKWLQEQLVDILGMHYGDWESAKQWAKLYEITHDMLPKDGDVCSEETGNQGAFHDEDWGLDDSNEVTAKPRIKATSSESSGSSSSNNWYKLSLPYDKIVIINTVKDLEDCCSHLTEYEVIAIDSEWTPGFARNGKVNVSLLQIATKDQVYLIDMCYFCNSESSHKTALCGFLKSIFSSNNSLKLGFGLTEDFRMLAAAFPDVAEVLKHTPRVIDLCSLVPHLDNLFPQVLKTSETIGNSVEADMTAGKKETGLSKLVHQCLGKPLNKCEQMSDWERRPLRQSQVLYAALDAYCLLEIYDLLNSRLMAAGIEHSLEKIKELKYQKKRIKRKPRVPNDAIQTAKNEEEDDQEKYSPPIRPQDFRVVCDNMLQGLGRQLRCCGVDVRILSNVEDHDIAADIAIREKRVILTSGTPYSYLSSQVGIGDCFNVPCGEKAKDQVAIVLDHYNVHVTPEDVFSRCQICNGNKYLKVAPGLMRQCMDTKQRILSGKQKCKNETMPIPWNKIRKSAPGSNKTYGRGWHDVNRQSSVLPKYPRCIGRGRAMREAMNQSVSKIASQLEGTSLACESEQNASSSIITCAPEGGSQQENDDHYDDDDGLVVCSTSPVKLLSESDFVPIECSQTPSDSVNDLMTGSDAASTSNHKDEFLDSNTEPGEGNTFKSDVCTGIASNKKPERETLTRDLQQTNLDKDGVLPYIINPNSICTQGHIDLENVTIVSSASSGDIEEGTSTDRMVVPLLCEQVPRNMLDRVEVFYCCVKCGKVFWEGRHFAHVLQQFSHVLYDS